MATTTHKQFLAIICLVLLITLTGCKPATPTQAPTPQQIEEFPVNPPPSDIPYDSISLERMLADLEELTTIRLHNGFRTAGTAGEAEAFEYVEAQLDKLAALKGMGMELERQSFTVYVTTQIHGNQLFLTPPGGVEVEVPANGMRGSRYNLENALYFDSDGILNDTESYRLTVSGETLLVRESDALFDLSAEDVTGKILFLDEHLFDAFSNNDYRDNRVRVIELINMAPAGVVLVSEYSNRDGASHASLLGDGTFLSKFDPHHPGPDPVRPYRGYAGKRLHNLERPGSARIGPDHARQRCDRPRHLREPDRPHPRQGSLQSHDRQRPYRFAQRTGWFR